MEPTFLQVGKKEMLSELVKYLAYDFNVRLSWIFNVDQYIIQIYNNEDIWLFSQNLVDISLKDGRTIREAKKYDLILKTLISGPKDYLLLIAFTNSYQMIGIDKVQLDEPFSPAKPIQWFTNQRHRISIFDSDIVEIPIIHAKAEISI